MNFWQKLKTPIFILAPMDGVTDTVFRQIVISCGRPDVLVTEFVPVDALLSSAQDRVIKNSLSFDESERPIVAQIWGTDPDKFREAAKILAKLGFDGIDINMGCPVETIIKKGACSALIKNPKLAVKIILATIDGAGNVPVSVKTRLGFDKLETEEWTKTLLSTPISALTLHLRTAAQMSKVPAQWDEIEKAVSVRGEIGSKALIIGNGDIKSLDEAQQMVSKYKIDGVMIGRGIFENVYLFNTSIDPEQVTPQQKMDLLLKHLDLFHKTWGDKRNFEIIKKFVKCYVNNFKGATDARDTLMKTKSMDELTASVKAISGTIH
jgi:nifR3 family TIM-barrel protein